MHFYNIAEGFRTCFVGIPLGILFVKLEESNITAVAKQNMPELLT